MVESSGKLPSNSTVVRHSVKDEMLRKLQAICSGVKEEEVGAPGVEVGSATGAKVTGARVGAVGESTPALTSPFLPFPFLPLPLPDGPSLL